MKVLVSDSIAPAAVQMMVHAGLEVEVSTGKNPIELKKIIPSFEAIVIRSQTKLTADLIQAASSLRLIVRAGVGLDNVDVTAAEKRGIPVMNTPFATTTSVAELTIALMLSLARKIPAASASVKRGEWDRKTFQGIELKEKHLAVIGLGRIGQEVVKRAKAFGMSVIAAERARDEEIAAALDIQLVTIETAIANADFVSIHLPLQADTFHLFNEAMLKSMKKGAFLINAARGGIVDEEALAKVLKSGHLRGAAIDVFEAEPPSKENPLLKLDTVIVVPHTGASTEEGQLRAGYEAAQIVIDFAAKR
ncbi:MAG: hydroxyacid dehydrogenase [Deltaproteobacteria bacterium]|nr:hydroxyacid dehydrogenase [Deltaproteobacteria bacterium]